MKINCIWDYDWVEESRVKFDLKGESRIAQLDFLQDCIGILTEKYNEVLDEFTVD